MIKKAKKFTSIILAVMLVVSCFAVFPFTSSAAAAGTTLPSVYATNPDGKVGKQASITIDGSFSDWSEDMLIAKGAAWDVANHWKGGHENCVLDTTALFGAWDNENLYIAWQMVNTTDTWGREGDGSLSDGGRVLDVPLILALSVDPNSVCMSNKNTDGGSIWGQKMGITFDTHVDRLLYMSGKVGNGQPGYFKAVDDQGNTNYTDGLVGFADGGIEYKMAEGNVCSSIMGLNASDSPDDVFSEDSDWVDYKTFKGSSGTHNTKYDSFYEIKIPFSTLGVDASYVAKNGIGAMLLATRGESALDCVPYDPSMVDNVTGSYSADPSTSLEKEDVDNITVPLAKIGGSGSPVIPTTAPATTAPQPQPTDAPAPTGSPAPTTGGDFLTVNAKSNVVDTVTKTYSPADKTLTLRYDFTCSEPILDGEAILTYDSKKLKLSASNYDEYDYLNIAPVITEVGGEVINEVPEESAVYINFTSRKHYDFTTAKPFVEVTFDILDHSGTADVNLYLKELDLSQTVILVYDGAPDNNYNTYGCKLTTTLSEGTVIPTTVPPTTIPISEDEIDVVAQSNLSASTTQRYNTKTQSAVTVTYVLNSAQKLNTAQWSLTYDPAVLKLSSANYVNGSLNVMPVADKVGESVANLSKAGLIKGVFSSDENVYDFTGGKTFVQVTFDIIGKAASTDVVLNVSELTFMADETTIDYMVADGVKTENYNATVTNTLSQATPGPVPTDPLPSVPKPTDPVPTDPVPTVKLGDVDLDGRVNVNDASELQLAVAKIKTLTEQQTKNADVDHDGRLTVNDVSLIQMYAARLITEF